MSEIADFLRARYQERRAVIEAMPRGPWTWVKVEGGTDTYECLGGPDGEVLSSGDAEGYRSWIDKHDALDGFLAVVQPEELLADLDAKLALVREHDPDSWSGENPSECPTCSRTTYDPQQPYEREPSPCRTLRILAQPFAGQPGHKGEEWAP